MTRNNLRHLSMFVNEPDPGEFFWVLHECLEANAVWIDINVSANSYLTWMAAFDEGVVQLMRMIHNEELGPRKTVGDEGASPVG